MGHGFFANDFFFESVLIEFRIFNGSFPALCLFSFKPGTYELSRKTWLGSNEKLLMNISLSTQLLVS